MANRQLLFWLALLCVVLGGTVIAMTVRHRMKQPITVIGTGTQAPADGADDSAPPRGSDAEWLTRFTLTDTQKRPFHSEDFAGKVAVVSFFFASCPSHCRLQNEEVQRLHREYADKDVQFVSITCDPKRDTPEALKKYARQFTADDKGWVFLTGNLKYIQRVGAEMYMLPVAEQSHRNSLVVVDKWGQRRGTYNWREPAQCLEMRTVIEQALAEKERPAGLPEQSPATEPPGDQESNQDDSAQDGFDEQGRPLNK